MIWWTVLWRAVRPFGTAVWSTSDQLLAINNCNTSFADITMTTTILADSVAYHSSSSTYYYYYYYYYWHRLPIFQVDLHCALHRVSTSSCRGHVDELPTEPFLLLHREHGTGYRRSWNCCDRRTCFIVIWKLFILSTGTRIRIVSVMRRRSSSKGRNTSAAVTVTVTV